MLVNVVVAAFVRSVLSLLVAGASAAYTRQQARSTSGLHDIERRREHEALQPTFEVTLDVAESDRDIARPKLQIRLTGPVELGRLNNVSVKIRDDPEQPLTIDYHPSVRVSTLHRCSLISRLRPASVRVGAG